MGFYWEYIEKKMSFEEITQERKKQLKRISTIRNNRDIIVYAADYSKGQAPISILYEDLAPFNDQLSNLNGKAVDLILETPGGSGEVAEDIVKTLRNKYDNVSVIIPGWAKSAGTIIAMASDDILMDTTSALGPIDAQLTWQGKTFSADALLKGFEKIKREVDEKQFLNQAYIPILQGISPGELESAQNSLDFAKDLVRDWLISYKFKDWNVHSSTGEEVTSEEKRVRANEIATELCNHEKWKTHGKSLRIKDLEEMGLKINNYEDNNDLNDAISRYKALLNMSFDTNIFKVIETSDTQIYRHLNSEAPPQSDNDVLFAGIECGKCKYKNNIQINLDTAKPVKKGFKTISKDKSIICEQCSTNINLEGFINDVQAQTRKNVIL
ncbi:Serine dehydrogenase proteinase [Oceanobacillus picturae]|uniref:Serine dehydrogenase proteinase n=1 Tax=Oceanobacillus picturae TaxID=171693 RepID=W9B9B2_9BACI|nr:ATP-dependent Clp protease proteolytic subunit [Oceanobacillus picturae]CDO03085.1 Serine dehydrogenase proteinase [Oceanobacillus picturae]